MRREWSDVRNALYELAADLGDARGRSEEVHLADALGRTTARSVTTPIPVPHFASSAMDGFAVAGSGPWRLLSDPVTDSGGRNVHRRAGSVSPGCARPVLTGSLLPEGTEGILRSEHVEVIDSTVNALPSHPYRPGRDIRRAGEELSRGSELVARGTVVGPRHLALLAACGVDVVTVRRPMTVSLAFTGNEVITSGVPQPGEVRDAFSTQFPTLLRTWGAEVTERTRLHDDADAVREWMSSASGDLVMLTGGSGSSSQDFVRQVLERMCTELVAASIAVRPGHPTIVGRLPGDRIVLGLPGNPLAAHTSLYSLAPMAADGFLGRGPAPLGRARLAEAAPPLAKGGTRLIPCTLDDGVVTPCPGPQAHMLSGLALADVLAVLPGEGASAGATVLTVPLD